MKHRPGDLSGGQQQRCVTADRRSHWIRPKIIVDEPTAYLDFNQMEEVLQLIRSRTQNERSQQCSNDYDP